LVANRLQPSGAERDGAARSFRRHQIHAPILRCRKQRRAGGNHGKKIAVTADCNPYRVKLFNKIFYGQSFGMGHFGATGYRVCRTWIGSALDDVAHSVVAVRNSRCASIASLGFRLLTPSAPTRARVRKISSKFWGDGLDRAKIQESTMRQFGVEAVIDRGVRFLHGAERRNKLAQHKIDLKERQKQTVPRSVWEHRPRTVERTLSIVAHGQAPAACKVPYARQANTKVSDSPAKHQSGTDAALRPDSNGPRRLKLAALASVVNSGPMSIPRGNNPRQGAISFVGDIVDIAVDAWPERRGIATLIAKALDRRGDGRGCPARIEACRKNGASGSKNVAKRGHTGRGPIRRSSTVLEAV